MPLIQIDAHWKKRVLAGRKAIEQYRAGHPQLYAGGYYKGIHDAHTPLLNTMKTELKEQGFNNLDEFFDACEGLNKQEYGMYSWEDIDEGGNPLNRVWY